MFGCANIFHLIEGVLVPHPEALSTGGFKLAIYSFTGGTSLVSWRGRTENSKTKDHDLAMPPG